MEGISCPIQPILNTMIRNFIRITYRNLIRDAGFSVINIAGLAIGMAASILILLWIQNELSYDEFHTNKDRIYQTWNRNVVNGKAGTSDAVSAPLAPAILKDIPEVERVVRAGSSGDARLVFGNKRL